jgi:hypothetical protein
VTNNNYRVQFAGGRRAISLVVEQSPRWEFRCPKAMHLRDRRVDLKCYLVEGDSGISTPQLTVLAGFPRARKGCFVMTSSSLATMQRLTKASLENLSEWVSRFGAR